MTEFLITLRESFEAVLIIAIIRWFLKKTWFGTVQYRNILTYACIFACVASLIFAMILTYIHDIFGVNGYEALFEWVLMVVTSCMLLYTIAWMSKQRFMVRGQKVDLPHEQCVTCPLVEETTSVKKTTRTGIKKTLEFLVDKQVWKNAWKWVGRLVFFALLREGVETVLLLFSALQITWLFSYSWFFWGILLALCLAYVVYILWMKLPLKYFFRRTSVLLVFFAAGMMTYGVHELEEFVVEKWIVEEASIVRARTVFPPAQQVEKKDRYTWNTEKEVYIHYLHDKGSVWIFLKSFLWWNSDPNILEPFVWILVLLYGLMLSWLIENRLRVE